MGFLNSKLHYVEYVVTALAVALIIGRHTFGMHTEILMYVGGNLTPFT